METVEEFINANRDSLIQFIQNQLDLEYNITDEEIESWIMNNEILYQWAIRSGVTDI